MPSEPNLVYSSRQALTLLELVIVLLILVALAGVVVPMVGSLTSDAKTTATNATLVNVRDAISQYWMDAPTPKRLLQKNDADGSRLPAVSNPPYPHYPQLIFLFVNSESWSSSAYSPTSTFDPNCKVGWRGPYLRQSTGTFRLDTARGFTNEYGNAGDPTLVDGWGQPIVVQNPGESGDGVLDVRVVSAGPNGKLEIDPTMSTLTLQSNPAFAGDDVWIAFELR